jgi:hypothetical protein
MDIQNCGIYFKQDEIIVIVKSGDRWWILGHPSIPLSECNEHCGGYRFQYSNYGKCRGTDSCCYARRFTLQELKRVASRYVRDCPVCGRSFITGGGKSADKYINAACPDRKCAMKWAENNESTEKRCSVCKKVCLHVQTVTTTILPHLHPNTIFVGSEFCLCPGNCCENFIRECRADLKIQAQQIYKNTTDYEIRRLLEHRFGNLDGTGT